MKYPKLWATLTEEPLLIEPRALASNIKLLERHLSMSSEEFRAAQREDGVDYCGEKVERDQAEIVNGVMIIPVGGPIGVGLGKFEKGAGCVDCTEILADLEEMETTEECRAGILHFDSPGGMVQGIAGVAARILACEKTIYAFTSGQMCSAAYWLGCSCDAVFATVDADIGSIGAYCYLLDQSKRYEAAGVKPVLVTSGKYKGMGAPGVSFTADQLALLQERINEISEKFYGHVEEMRGGAVSREDMQGQTFAGDRAVVRGLIDVVVGDLEEVAELL